VTADQHDTDAAEPTTIGELLRHTLDAQDMSQAELAKATGLSTKHINQVLQGDIALSPYCAWLIGHELGIRAEVWLTLQVIVPPAPRCTFVPPCPECQRRQAEQEAGHHRRGDRIVHRLCGDWEPVEGADQ
jgi:plasmid maintenance system antidote protein VapI